MSDFYIQHNEANFVGDEAGIEVVERRFLAGGVSPGKGGWQTRDTFQLCRQAGHVDEIIIVGVTSFISGSPPISLLLS
jgi:hypothetical protein